MNFGAGVTTLDRRVFAILSPTWAGVCLLFLVANICSSLVYFHISIRKIYTRSGVHLLMKLLCQRRCVLYNSEIFWYIYAVSRHIFCHFERTEYVKVTSFLQSTENRLDLNDGQFLIAMRCRCFFLTTMRCRCF